MSVSRVPNFLRVVVLVFTAAIFSLMANGYAFAQNTFGSLSNFDVFNDTGQETHGFEIELDGIASTDVSFTFGAPYQRYGNPQVSNFNNGVTSGAIVRYISSYDAVNKVFSVGTPMASNPIIPTMGHACWTGGTPPVGAPPYATAGCEHFGLGLAKNPTATAYHWLIADPANPGSAIQSPTKVTVPAPVMAVYPPPVPAGQPVVQAIVPAQPPEAAEFGDAQWVKVYVKESPGPADLNHLVTDDPGVPNDPVEIETEWSLLQFDSGAAGGGGGARKEQENHAEMGKGNQSVTRRYEFYKFAGTYDPVSHEALPAVSDSSPQPNEIGDYEGAQMAAVNIVAPTATATATATATPTATPTPLPGQVMVVPGKLNFGNAVYGGIDLQGQVVTKFASVFNTSKTLSAPINASTDGDFTLVSGGKQACTTQLAAKQRCTLGVAFQPRDFGPRSSLLTIGGLHVATLAGNGTAGKIVLPGAINFGKVKAGTLMPKTAMLTNKSSVPIEVMDIEILNDTTDFSVDQKCVAALLTKAPCAITVTFSPKTGGRKTAQLKIGHAAAGSPHTVNLVGTAF
jgi:hypothetical protein